jgi:hypothetical protein
LDSVIISGKLKVLFSIQSIGEFQDVLLQTFAADEEALEELKLSWAKNLVLLFYEELHRLRYRCGNHEPYFAKLVSMLITQNQNLYTDEK